MKVNINTLKRCIANTSELGYPRIEEHDEGIEKILRFKDTNNSHYQFIIAMKN